MRFRRLVAAWIALLLLLAGSAGSAWMHLGSGLLLVSLAIATAKSAIVGGVFMELDVRGRPLLRLVAAAGLSIVLLPGAVGLVDVLTRQDEATAWQLPQAVAPAWIKAAASSASGTSSAASEPAPRIRSRTAPAMATDAE